MSDGIGLGISALEGETGGSGGGNRRENAFLIKDANPQFQDDPLLSRPIQFPSADPNQRFSAAFSFTSISSHSSSIGPLSSSDGCSSSPEQGSTRKFKPSITSKRSEPTQTSQRSTNPQQRWQALSFGERSRAGSIISKDSPDDSTSIRSTLSASTTSSPSLSSSPDLSSQPRKPETFGETTTRLRRKTSQKFALRKATSSITLSSSSKSSTTDTTDRATLRGTRPTAEEGKEKAKSTRSTTGRYRKSRPDVLTFDFNQLVNDSASTPLVPPPSVSKGQASSTFLPSPPSTPTTMPTTPTTIRERPRSRTIGEREGEKEKTKSSGMFGFLKRSSSPVPTLPLRSTTLTLSTPSPTAPRTSTDSKDDGARRSFWNQISRSRNTASPPGETTESDGSSSGLVKGGNRARKGSPLPWFRRGSSSRTESPGGRSTAGETKAEMVVAREEVLVIAAHGRKESTIVSTPTPFRHDSTPSDGHILPFDVLQHSLATASPTNKTPPSLKNKISGSFRYPTQLSPPSRRPSLTPALLSPPVERTARPIASRRLPATMRISMVVESTDSVPTSLSPIATTPTHNRLSRSISVDSLQSNKSTASINYDSDASLV